MPNANLSRREFIKLASLSVFTLAAATPSRHIKGLITQPAVRPALKPVQPKQLDVLTFEQRQRLLTASHNYLAPYEELAKQIALDIDFIEGLNEHPSTMCGPLAISILQSAKLLGPWVRPRDFWLLNPGEDLRTAAYTFPKENYHWYYFESPISTFDFSHFPLVAGDLLYLHAGSGDTFEHILVVNHVDENGLAYTVSNFFTDSGTVIEERTLYDPIKPGEGQFNAWADRKFRNTIGITGSGGFRVWRVKDGRSLQFPSYPASQTLQQELDDILINGLGSWFVSIKELDGPTLYQFNPYEAFHPASTIKVPISMAFYSWLDKQTIEDVEGYLITSGTHGRTYLQLLTAMIVESEEEATEALVDFLGAAQIEEIWHSWGLNYTKVNPRRSSATEIISLLEGLFIGRWLSPGSRAHLLDLMAIYTENDDTRIGLIRGELAEDAIVYNKRGSLVASPRVVADSGIIQLGSGSGKTYLFSLHGLGSDGSSYEALERQLDEAITVFGAFLTSG